MNATIGVGAALGSHLTRAYQKSIEELRQAPPYARLASGRATRAEYDAFVLELCKTHSLSAHFVAFAFSLAPPGAASTLQHNLLEELGADGGEAHPRLLVRLLAAAGLGHELPAVERAGRLRLDDKVLEPLFYGSLRDVGLAALVEIVGFEVMLSQVASEMASFLREFRALPDDALAWFTHHAEVDREHAEQGKRALCEYVEHYRFVLGEALTIVDATLDQNIYLARYFGPGAAAAARAEPA
jgi:pyrroloquinoline quinone (PQQ) biosynthesis protein C